MMEPDTSFTEVDLKQEKFEDVSEEGEKFHCSLSDKEMVHKIALVLFEGLSTACVDNTTGDIFRSPGTVAAEIRKEMLEYLTERSQTFVAESLFSEDRPEEELSDQPSDIISYFIEDFAGLKRNFLSRVSGWLLSEMRDDKIDDFVQEMELNSFWLLDRREAIAQNLLKNVDFKNEFHCKKKFKSEVELERHLLECGFRTLLCENEGCSATYSAAHKEKHDSVCPFKMLPCEQKCPAFLIRQEMDKHCITVCPMKPVNCPFYSIGCKATVPNCNIKQHFADDVRFHLLFALMYLHKGASAEDLRSRADQIEQESIDRLFNMTGVRSFTNAVKILDYNLGPIMIVKKQESEEHTASEVEKTDSGESLEADAGKSNSPKPPTSTAENSDDNPKAEDTNQSNDPPSENPEISHPREPLSEDSEKLDSNQIVTENQRGSEALKPEEGENKESEAPKGEGTEYKETEAPKGEGTEYRETEAPKAEGTEYKETEAPKAEETEAPKAEETEAPKAEETESKESEAPQTEGAVKVDSKEPAADQPGN